MVCTQCQSPHVVENLRVLDQIGEGNKSDLALETHLSPQAIFLTDAVTIPLSANVCQACGNVMFAVSAEGLEQINQAAEALKEVEHTDPDLKSSPGFGMFLGDDGEEVEQAEEVQPPPLPEPEQS